MRCGGDSYFLAGPFEMRQGFRLRDRDGDSAAALLNCGRDSYFAAALLTSRQRILPRDGDPDSAAGIFFSRQAFLSAPDLMAPRQSQGFTAGRLTLRQRCWICDRESSPAAEPQERNVLSRSALKIGSCRRSLREKAPK